MNVTRESCNCVLNFMLGQPDKVRSSPSKVAMFHPHGWNHMVSLGEGEWVDAHWDSNIMFIHTSKRQDDMPWQLVMLRVCLIKLAAFANDVFSM